MSTTQGQNLLPPTTQINESDSKKRPLEDDDEDNEESESKGLTRGKNWTLEDDVAFLHLVKKLSSNYVAILEAMQESEHRTCLLMVAATHQTSLLKSLTT